MPSTNIVAFPNRAAYLSASEISQSIKDEPALTWKVLEEGQLEDGIISFSRLYQRVVGGHSVEIERIKEVNDEHISAFQHLLALLPGGSDLVKFSYSARIGSKPVPDDEAKRLYYKIDDKYGNEERRALRDAQKLLAEIARDPLLDGKLSWTAGGNTFNAVTEDGWYCRAEILSIPNAERKFDQGGKISVTKKFHEMVCFETVDGEVAAKVVKQLLNMAA